MLTLVLLASACCTHSVTGQPSSNHGLHMQTASCASRARTLGSRSINGGACPSWPCSRPVSALLRCSTIGRVSSRMFARGANCRRSTSTTKIACVTSAHAPRAVVWIRALRPDACVVTAQRLEEEEGSAQAASVACRQFGVQPVCRQCGFQLRQAKVALNDGAVKNSHLLQLGGPAR